jgi:arylformamidase
MAPSGRPLAWPPRMTHDREPIRTIACARRAGPLTAEMGRPILCLPGIQNVVRIYERRATDTDGGGGVVDIAELVRWAREGKLQGELHDLSQPMADGMLIPPALRKAGQRVTIEPLATHERNGFEAGRFAAVVHSGTHVDAPRHFIADGETLGEIGLAPFVGAAYVVDLRDLASDQPVTADLLESRAPRRRGLIYLLSSGWGETRWGTDAYWDTPPYLGDDAAEWLVAAGARAVGFDFFQERAARADTIRPELYTTHRTLLGARIPLIEHLTNLSPLVGREVFFVCLPWYLAAAEGAPTRAIALT